MIWWIIGFLLYEISCIVWFINGIKRKTQPDRWYDCIFFPGIMLIAFPCGLYNALTDKFK